MQSEFPPGFWVDEISNEFPLNKKLKWPLKCLGPKPQVYIEKRVLIIDFIVLMRLENEPQNKNGILILKTQ